MSHASGSAHLRLANTDVMVGVKAELGENTIISSSDQGFGFDSVPFHHRCMKKNTVTFLKWLKNVTKILCFSSLVQI